MPPPRNGASGGHRRHVGLRYVEHFGLHRVVEFLGQGFALDEQLDARALHFRVGRDAHDGCFVVRYRDFLLVRSVRFRSRYVAHEFLHLGFDGVHIHVAHYDDCLVVRAVPLVVEVAQRLVVEALQIVQVADQIAVFVFRAFAQRLDHRHHRAPLGTVARAEFFADYAAFRVDFVAFECNEVRPVVQNQQRRVDHSFAGRRHVLDLVGRVVPARRGVQVVAEFHAHGLQVFRQHLARQVLRAVERHVFEEVGQTLLIVVFLNGAYVMQNVEVCLSLRFFVVADVVGHAVFQLARAHRFVGRNRCHHARLGRHASRGEHRKQQEHQFFLHTLFFF